MTPQMPVCWRDEQLFLKIVPRPDPGSTEEEFRVSLARCPAPPAMHACHCYQFFKRPYSFEKETQNRPVLFLKRDLKETFDFKKRDPQ